jgi:hypothetical protein
LLLHRLLLLPLRLIQLNLLCTASFAAFAQLRLLCSCASAAVAAIARFLAASVLFASAAAAIAFDLAASAR